jgi:hypothetical protein
MDMLAEAGIVAVLTPYKLLERGDAAPGATAFLVHRVEVPEADAARAAVILLGCGLLVRESELTRGETPGRG